MELIVVIVIISIMLVFAMPELSGRIFRDDNKTAINWIIFNVSKLKNQAVNQGKDFFMCVNQDTNTISIRETGEDKDNLQPTGETATSDDSDGSDISKFLMPENLSLDGVEFNYQDQKVADAKKACIEFHKQGYSDQAIIHISNSDGTGFSCLIRPFLNKVKIYQGNKGFE